MHPEYLQFPRGLDPEEFLSRYWQRHPLLMRQALPGYRPPLTPDELAGLACEPEVESRLVLEKDGSRPWEARLGPFTEADFAALPETHWTLLVQDMDKHVPEVARLLEPFRFLPEWRLDDIMVSYAPDRGSVGPHIDDYDVFLVQVMGRRRWRIHTRPVSEEDYIPGLDLRILPRFEAEEDWVLQPGDLLYLPPNVAHWGIAEGDCMTFSVGFRAPVLRDLALSWYEELVGERIPAGRYRDPNLAPQADCAEILPSVFDRVETLLERLRSSDPDQLRRWLGRYLTETKENLQLVPPDPPLDDLAFRNQFVRHALLLRSGYARMAFRHGADGRHLLFVNGRDYAHSGNGGFLHAITQEREIHYGYLTEWLDDPHCLHLLCRLYNDGVFEFPDD